MMNSFRIRPATTKDETIVIELFTSFMQEVESENPGIDFKPYIERALRDELEKLDSYYFEKARNEFLVAELENAVVATVGFEEVSAFTAEIRRLIVSKKHRRHGIATGLMNTAETRCHEHGYREVILETSEFQPASIASYERLGYTQQREFASSAKAHKSVAGIERYKFRKTIH